MHWHTSISICGFIRTRILPHILFDGRQLFAIEFPQLEQN
jgi:hypothetical protein